MYLVCRLLLEKKKRLMIHSVDAAACSFSLFALITPRPPTLTLFPTRRSSDLDSCDLLLSGVIDSLGLVELMTALQERCGREIDFDALDPEQMTKVGPLCDFEIGRAHV